MSLATTRDQISAWKHYFEGRVVISSASGKERGEVFYRPTDWLGSCDPMRLIMITPLTHCLDWMTDAPYYMLIDDSDLLTDTCIMLTVYYRLMTDAD
jgi:hypothetical protein